MNEKERFKDRICAEKAKVKTCRDLARIAARFGMSTATVRRIWLVRGLGGVSDSKAGALISRNRAHK